MTVLVWVVVAAFGSWAGLRFSMWEVNFTWVQLVAFTPAVALISLVAPVLALLTRRWTALAVGVAVSGMLATMVLPRAIADSNPVTSGSSLRVLASNLKVGDAPPEALTRLVRDLRADVLAVQELTPAAAEGLEAAGLSQVLPFHVGEARPGVGGSGIYSRFPLTMTELLDFGGFGQARATVETPGGKVDIVSVHPCAPVEKSLHRCWEDGLAALPRPDGTPKVLLGDFNATLDHVRMRDLLTAGYRDAADATGNGLTPTWPSIAWTLYGLPIPPVTLDHILVNQATAVHAFSTHTLPETDHRAVFATLSLP
ncbi:endonuclease [Acrocarpospora phusangensis]|uniref:Endonuclease n=1 Tax=Acrocarpospora phusangensis TaxID=1070424 RepID=A0A919QE16_9ACTN|nr:endonuclease [Acrocarpospora phusangensis]